MVLINDPTILIDDPNTFINGVAPPFVPGPIALAACTVEVAFGSDPLTLPFSWTDITDYLRRASTRRGRNHELGKTSSGVATFTLDNRDRRFDPTNTSSPYYPNIRPMQQIRLRVTADAITYDLFRGFVEDWGQQWGGPADVGEGDAICEVQAVDGFKLLELMQAMSYRDAVLMDQPALYFPMDDPAGSTQGMNLGDGGDQSAADVLTYFPIPGAGSITPGVRTDGPFASTATQPAVDFRNPTDAGSPAYLPAADVTLQASPLTIEFWIRPDTLTGTPNYIVSQAGDYWHVITSATGQVSFEYVANRTHGVGFTGVGSTANLTPAGQTHHIAVVRDVDSISFYQDGVWSQTYDGYADPVAIPGGAFGLNKIGSSFDGVLAHLAIYPTALTADQIATHYAAACDLITNVPSGAAIDGILNCVGWAPTLRSIGVGASNVTLTPSSSALDVVQQIGEDTEHGIVEITPDGKFTFIDRSALHTPGASLATFGDGGGAEIPYRELVLSYDDQDLWTEVVASSPEGTFTADDDAAVATYGRRTLSVSTLEATANATAAQATGLLNRYKAPAIRPTSVTFMGPRSITQQLSRAIGDRVTVIRRPPGIGVLPSTLVPGSVGLYDFSDISTLWKDTARTIPVTTAGDIIKGVTDLSGAGNHLSSATNGPAYTPGVQNGLSVARFDGTNDILSSSAITADTSFTTFIVGVKRSAASGSSRDLFAYGNNSQFFANSGVDATKWCWFADFGGASKILGGTVTSWSIIGMRVNSAASQDVWFDGGTKTNFDPNNEVTTSTSFALGATPGLSSFGDVDVAYVVRYPSALSDADIARNDTFLGEKWGLTVADTFHESGLLDPLTVDALIEGVNHDVGPEGWLTTTFALAPPDPAAFWLLGTSTLGTDTFPGW